MKKFSSADLGLSGDLDVMLPNSINRSLGDRLQEHRMLKNFYVTYVRQD